MTRIAAYIWLFWTLASSIQGYKVLLVPLSFTSHVFQFQKIGEALLANGHEVTMILAPSLPSYNRIKENTKIEIIAHHTPHPDIFSSPDSMEEINKFTTTAAEMGLNPWDTFPHVLAEPNFANLCHNLLSDTELQKKITDIGFDMALTDAIPLFRCAYVMLYKLGIPYASFFSATDPGLTRTITLPSVSPHPGSEPYSEQMTFLQRLYNTWKYLKWYALSNGVHVDNSYTIQYAPEKEPFTLNQLATKSVLLFSDIDFALDYARPQMPHEVGIGGLTTGDAKPLPDDLQKYMDSSKHGVVVVSFGSTLTNIPPVVMQGLLKVLGRLKEDVIWKLPNYKDDLPVNIQSVKWMPQNDLLGHPNTKLFVTHCGANGQYEGLYHGIPMIGIPIASDAFYNAIRMEYRGYGKSLNPKTFTVDALEDAVNEVLNNASYKENVIRGSNIFKDQTHRPTERAVYWMEHVIKYGSAHLHSHALDMPVYQFLMLDILALVALSSVILVASVSYVIKKCLSLRSLKTKVKTN